MAGPYKWQTTYVPGEGRQAMRTLQKALEAMENAGWEIFSTLHDGEAYCIVSRRLRQGIDPIQVTTHQDRPSRCALLGMINQRALPQPLHGASEGHV